MDELELIELELAGKCPYCRTGQYAVYKGPHYDAKVKEWRWCRQCGGSGSRRTWLPIKNRTDSFDQYDVTSIEYPPSYTTNTAWLLEDG